MQEFLKESLAYIHKQYQAVTPVGIILGTGLGGLVREIKVEKEIPYSDIPHFPVSTVESHSGRLIFGTAGDKKVVVMQGRFHYYEGYNMAQVTYPVRVMKLLGVESLLISNVSGSMNPDIRKGELMIIDDHINLQTANPLTGKNLDDFGPRFPDMSQPYNPELIRKAERIAAEEGIRLHKGVYVAVNGPNLETRAEYRFLRRIGADVVGMSTVPEVIVARHMNLKVFAISLVTDECDPDNLHPVSVQDILRVAAASEPALTKIVLRLVES